MVEERRSASGTVSTFNVINGDGKDNVPTEIGCTAVMDDDSSYNKNGNFRELTMLYEYDWSFDPTSFDKNDDGNNSTSTMTYYDNNLGRSLEIRTSKIQLLDKDFLSYVAKELGIQQTCDEMIMMFPSMVRDDKNHDKTIHYQDDRVDYHDYQSTTTIPLKSTGTNYRDSHSSQQHDQQLEQSSTSDTNNKYQMDVIVGLSLVDDNSNNDNRLFSAGTCRFQSCTNSNNAIRQTNSDIESSFTCVTVQGAIKLLVLRQDQRRRSTTGEEEELDSDRILDKLSTNAIQVLEQRDGSLIRISRLRNSTTSSITNLHFHFPRISSTTTSFLRPMRTTAIRQTKETSTTSTMNVLRIGIGTLAGVISILILTICGYFFFCRRRNRTFCSRSNNAFKKMRNENTKKKKTKKIESLPSFNDGHNDDPENATTESIVINENDALANKDSLIAMTMQWLPVAVPSMSSSTCNGNGTPTMITPSSVDLSTTPTTTMTSESNTSIHNRNPSPNANALCTISPERNDALNVLSLEITNFGSNTSSRHLRARALTDDGEDKPPIPREYQLSVRSSSVSVPTSSSSPTGATTSISKTMYDGVDIDNLCVGDITSIPGYSEDDNDKESNQNNNNNDIDDGSAADDEYSYNSDSTGGAALYSDDDYMKRKRLQQRMTSSLSASLVAVLQAPSSPSSSPSRTITATTTMPTATTSLASMLYVHRMPSSSSSTTTTTKATRESGGQQTTISKTKKNNESNTATVVTATRNRGIDDDNRSTNPSSTEEDEEEDEDYYDSNFDDGDQEEGYL